MLLSSAAWHWPFDHKMKAAGWTYEVREDRFANLKSCTLYRRGVTYANRTLTFHLPREIDTSQAIYRVDDSETQPWRVSAMELASSGVALVQDDLRNPSGGLVPVPARTLASARVVIIRPSEKAKPVKFRIEGFSTAMAAATAAGCAPQSFR
jgi:hypothetical protein